MIVRCHLHVEHKSSTELAHRPSYYMYDSITQLLCDVVWTSSEKAQDII